MGLNTSSANMMKCVCSETQQDRLNCKRLSMLKTSSLIQCDIGPHRKCKMSLLRHCTVIVNMVQAALLASYSLSCHYVSEDITVT